jgi:hypothetical protein|tara:strand:- start:1796 stop:2017 length:222 start_codon:yes stop_codon:yes gene_type:complete
MKIKTHKNLSLEGAINFVKDRIKKKQIRKPEGSDKQVIYVDGTIVADILVVDFKECSVRVSTEEESFNYHHQK